MTETPREIYRAACDEIGSRFDGRGYTYRKSEGGLIRESGEFTYAVWLTTSRWNRTGEYVGFGISALNVRSRELARWRAGRGRNPDDWVAGGLPSNLGLGSEWRYVVGLAHEWDLSDPSRRPEVVDLAERRIAEATAFFERFDDPPRLVRTLSRGAVPAFSALDAVEWLLSHDESDVAISHGRAILGDEKVKARYDRRLASSGQQSDPLIRRIDDAEGLAWAATVYGVSF